MIGVNHLVENIVKIQDLQFLKKITLIKGVISFVLRKVYNSFHNDIQYIITYVHKILLHVYVLDLWDDILTGSRSTRQSEPETSGGREAGGRCQRGGSPGVWWGLQHQQLQAGGDHGRQKENRKPGRHRHQWGRWTVLSPECVGKIEGGNISEFMTFNALQSLCKLKTNC